MLRSSFSGKLSLILAAGLLLAAAPAHANMHKDHKGHSAAKPTPACADEAPVKQICTKGKISTCTTVRNSSVNWNSTREPASNAGFEAANERMHQAMDLDYTGVADVDFARAMIPHHQGAIDMANVVLKHGTDKKIRKLAQNIVKTQQDEIIMMARWLVDYTNSVNNPQKKPAKQVKTKPAAKAAQ
jgi:hypothetical protein